MTPEHYMCPCCDVAWAGDDDCWSCHQPGTPKTQWPPRKVATERKRRQEIDDALSVVRRLLGVTGGRS